MKAKKKKPEPIDGISPRDLQRIRTALRQVWSWSVMHRLVRKRCQLPGKPGEDTMYRCEQCGGEVPKIYVDHIDPCGGVLQAGFIERMFVPSKLLQGLCKRCHSTKTREERKLIEKVN